MKTEFEKMRSGELACIRDPEIQRSARRAKQLCARLQHLNHFDNGYRELIGELIPGMPATAIICPPFRCDHGNGITLGEHVFINYNCTFLDGGGIRIGDHTLIGPDCHLYTPQHPMDYIERREPQEYSFPITIGADCWLGGNVTVCPGVTIGDRCIIAAGSVVTRDIPSDSLAAGNPAVVKKRLNTTRTPEE